MVVALAHFVCLWACAACTRPEPSQPHSNQNFSVKHQNINPIVDITDFQIPVFPMNLERADHLQHQHDATFHGEPHLATYHTGESLVDTSRRESLPKNAETYLGSQITANPDNNLALVKLRKKAREFYAMKPEKTRRKTASRKQRFEHWEHGFLLQISDKRYGITLMTKSQSDYVEQSLKTLEYEIEHFPGLDLLPDTAVTYLNSLSEHYPTNGDLTKLKKQAELFYNMCEDAPPNTMLTKTPKRLLFKDWENDFLLAINGRKYGAWLENGYLVESVDTLTQAIAASNRALIATLKPSSLDTFQSDIADLPDVDLPIKAQTYLNTLIEKNPSYADYLRQLKENAELFYKMARHWNQDKSLTRGFENWKNNFFLPAINRELYGTWLEDEYLKQSLIRLEDKIVAFRHISN